MPSNHSELELYCQDLGKKARQAFRILATIASSKKNDFLKQAAVSLEARNAEVLEANAHDLAEAETAGLSKANLDRLKLTRERIKQASVGLLEVACLPDPVGRILESRTRPNGLEIHKVGVPLGVIFFIYESRPNVTLDAAAICIKSGNAIILRGGKEAMHSNQALYRILTDSLAACDLPPDSIQLVNTSDRAAVGHLLRLKECIDLTIPRGGPDLIRRVAEEARMPVMKHYQGICHLYIDKSADLAMAEKLVMNSKCQRPGVCNALESLLVHRKVADEFIPRLARKLIENAVEIRGCTVTNRLVPDAKLATEKDYATEWLDLILSIKVVADVAEATEHIACFGSGHTDGIVSHDKEAIQRFTTEVDSSAVMVNASTRFNDGYELGLGAEIGISTDKFHARGPCGLQELCSYKYIVQGNGQVRGE